MTRLLEGGAPLAVVASIMGWSAATTVRMVKRYGHIGQVAQRQALQILDNLEGTESNHPIDEPKPQASGRPN